MSRAISFNVQSGKYKKIADGLYKEGLLKDGDVAGVTARDLMIAAQNPKFGQKVAGYQGGNPFDFIKKEIYVNAVNLAPEDTGVLKSTIWGVVRGKGDKIEFEATAGKTHWKSKIQTTFLKTYQAPMGMNRGGKNVLVKQSLDVTSGILKLTEGGKFYHKSLNKMFGQDGIYAVTGGASIGSKAPLFDSDGKRLTTTKFIKGGRKRLSTSRKDRAYARVGIYAPIQEELHHFLRDGMKKSQNEILRQYLVAYEMALQRLVSLNTKAGLV